METMPPVMLGATILVPFALAFALRSWIEYRFVLGVDEFKQTLRQFQLDVSLYILAGFCVAVFNYFVYGFPVLSGISFVFGCLVMGFFVALDTALWRERVLIFKAKMQITPILPPKKLYPMSRRFSMVAVVTAIFVMVVMALVISRDFAWLNSMDSDPTRIYQAERSVMIEVVFITAVLLVMMINLIVSYSKNLQLLFRNETGVLEKVRQGDLSNLVPIVTQDEFGLIAGHTNYMIQGLRHRLELIASIKLAEEIQRNLLPINPPDIKGVDLAGASIYCNETGGDYYDFFSLPKARLGVVVADAADHGLGSAMHMTSARAFLRAVMDSYTTPSQTISTLNSYLTRDSRNTGRFMTLFFLEIDPAKRQLSWVRAGHEPALLYDPIKKEMKVLDGSGVALGISEKVVYQTGRYENLAQGAVLVIGTDGIWETRNAAGEMFGKERLIRTIKSSAKKKDSAQKLLDRILTRINNWRGEQVQEDDTTLVTVILS